MNSGDDELCFIRRSKGHDMLAPFTAGWQSADLHPLIIAKSEVTLLLLFGYVRQR